MNLSLRFRVHDTRRGSSFLRAAGRLAAFSLVALPLVYSRIRKRSNRPSRTLITRSQNNATPASVDHVKLLLEKGNPALEIEPPRR